MPEPTFELTDQAAGLVEITTQRPLYWHCQHRATRFFPLPQRRRGTLLL
jgi:hypothetical protein